MWRDSHHSDIKWLGRATVLHPRWSVKRWLRNGIHECVMQDKPYGLFVVWDMNPKDSALLQRSVLQQ